MANYNLPPGPGRPKGVPNKATMALKEMILGALEAAGNELEPNDPKGGIAYLKLQSMQEPVAFMALVGKVLPLQVAGDPSSPLMVQIIDYANGS